MNTIMSEWQAQVKRIRAIEDAKFEMDLEIWLSIVDKALTHITARIGNKEHFILPKRD